MLAIIFLDWFMKYRLKYFTNSGSSPPLWLPRPFCFLFNQGRVSGHVHDGFVRGIFKNLHSGLEFIF